ncbi:adenylyl-sulfate kinase [Flavobacteriaceae bacterium GSB9]|nr:adenylyl-sulfate kinase [Flavobacteriaceae bacterium GSB9]
MKHNKKQKYSITQQDRRLINNHKPCLIWFTGLSGSGKSTIANLLEKELHKQQVHTYTLDGDNLRRGLNKDLKFTKEDRTENLRRTAEVAKLFIDAGMVVIAAFITPYNSIREMIKTIVGDAYYIEVFVNTPLEVCEKRDVKGLYKKARSGEIKNFTGISAPFEIPEQPTLEIKTLEEPPEDAVNRILELLTKRL